MLKRRYVGPLGLVAGLAALAATGCSEQNAALRVGDETVSHSELVDLADVQVTMAGDELTSGIVGASDGSYTQAYMGQIASDAVLVALSTQYLDQVGMPVSEQEVQSQLSQVVADPAAAGLPAGFADLSDDDQATFVENAITVNNVASQLQATSLEQFVSTLMAELELDDDDIYVNPRYGSWDPATATITPPDGPLEQTGGGSDEEIADSLPIGVE